MGIPTRQPPSLIRYPISDGVLPGDLWDPHLGISSPDLTTDGPCAESSSHRRIVNLVRSATPLVYSLPLPASIQSGNNALGKHIRSSDSPTDGKRCKVRVVPQSDGLTHISLSPLRVSAPPGLAPPPPPPLSSLPSSAARIPLPQYVRQACTPPRPPGIHFPAPPGSFTDFSASHHGVPTPLRVRSPPLASSLCAQSPDAGRHPIDSPLDCSLSVMHVHQRHNSPPNAAVKARPSTLSVNNRSLADSSALCRDSLAESQTQTHTRKRRKLTQDMSQTHQTHPALHHSLIESPTPATAAAAAAPIPRAADPGAVEGDTVTSDSLCSMDLAAQKRSLAAPMLVPRHTLGKLSCVNQPFTGDFQDSLGIPELSLLGTLTDTRLVSVLLIDTYISMTL